MGKAFNVSDNIGFDGNSYYCRRCGKAGYWKATQVRGHLAMCPGTLARKGVSPTTSCNQLPSGNGAGLQESPANQLQPVRGASGGGLGGSQLLQPVVVDGPVANPLAGGYQELERRVGVMENHYNHFLMDRNQPEYQSVKQDFFTQYKGVIIVGALILLAMLLSNKGCSEPSTGKGVNVGDIGGRALSKLVDTGITKGVASLFK